MSTSTWDGPQSYTDEVYPTRLLKYILKDMMTQFVAQGAAIALFDEASKQMQVYLHVRSRSTSNMGNRGLRPRRTGSLEQDMPASLPLIPEDETESHSPSQALVHALPPLAPPEELEEISSEQSGLFAVGNCYPLGKDLIGFVWAKNEPVVLRHDEYLARFFHGNSPPFIMDVTPINYFVIPIQESTLVDDMHDRGHHAQILGVIVLYQTIPSVVTTFQNRQRTEALQYVERIALYLQNDKLQRAQQRTSEYLKHIQELSTVFPSNVKPSSLVSTLYTYASRVVDISSLLFTLYDRDTDKIYDVLAIHDGIYIDGLVDDSNIKEPNDRPVWWHATLEKKQPLLFSPANDSDKVPIYGELLTGLWGDQRNAESFVLLPMKMSGRIVGSLCLTSMRPYAYKLEEVQVLETMVQILTVSIENTKLYERDRTLLNQAQQREEQLATLNSALQSISSGLNLNDILDRLIQVIGSLLHVDICAFFQPSADGKYLVAKALYTPPVQNPEYDEEVDVRALILDNKQAHAELIEQISLPFQGTVLEQQLHSGPFFMLDSGMIEELAQQSEEGGVIFLRDTHMQQLMMLPLFYEKDFLGMVAVSTPHETRRFRPKEIGTLIAMSSQAINAIRNAQLFAERGEAYAELQQLSRMKDEFMTTASHELRTPLSAITGYSTLLRRQNGRSAPLTTQQVTRYATKIASAAQQLNDIMTNMTEASKIGTVDRKLELQIGPVRVDTAVEVAANMLSINIEQRISAEVDRDLYMLGDPLHIRQVITNLLDNAAKYSLPESIIRITATATVYKDVEPLLQSVQITGAERENQSVILVRVIDHGEGILPQDQKTIFDKFVRAPRSLTTPVRGSGLGLYICRRYVEAMNGKLWLERSVPNEGSTFSFYLPQAEVPSKEEEQDEDERSFSIL